MYIYVIVYIYVDVISVGHRFPVPQFFNVIVVIRMSDSPGVSRQSCVPCSLNEVSAICPLTYIVIGDACK